MHVDSIDAQGALESRAGDLQKSERGGIVTDLDDIVIDVTRGPGCGIPVYKLKQRRV